MSHRSRPSRSGRCRRSYRGSYCLSNCWRIGRRSRCCGCRSRRIGRCHRFGDCRSRTGSTRWSNRYRRRKRIGGGGRGKRGRRHGRRWRRRTVTVPHKLCKLRIGIIVTLLKSHRPRRIGTIRKRSYRNIP